MATPLTTPVRLGPEMTQYRFDRVEFDLEDSDVAVTVSLLDSGGRVVLTQMHTASFSQLGLTPAEVAPIRTKIVTYLKGLGVLN